MHYEWRVVFFNENHPIISTVKEYMFVIYGRIKYWAAEVLFSNTV